MQTQRKMLVVKFVGFLNLISWRTLAWTNTSQTQELKGRKLKS